VVGDSVEELVRHVGGGHSWSPLGSVEGSRSMAQT
jgi:hypothetical protein